MVEKMVMMELLINDCGNECKVMFKEKLKKNIIIVMFSIFVIGFIIILCIIVGVLYEKKIFIQVDCVLYFMLENDLIKICLYVDCYFFFNEVYVMICVNNIIEIDIW